MYLGEVWWALEELEVLGAGGCGGIQSLAHGPTWRGRGMIEMSLGVTGYINSMCKDFPWTLRLDSSTWASGELDEQSVRIFGKEEKKLGACLAKKSEQ